MLWCRSWVWWWVSWTLVSHVHTRVNNYVKKTPPSIMRTKPTVYALTFGDSVGVCSCHLCRNTYRFLINILKFSLACCFVLLYLLLELLQSRMNECIFYAYTSPFRRISILLFSQYYFCYGVLLRKFNIGFQINKMVRFNFLTCSWIKQKNVPVVLYYFTHSICRNLTTWRHISKNSICNSGFSKLTPYFTHTPAEGSRVYVSGLSWNVGVFSLCLWVGWGWQSLLDGWSLQSSSKAARLSWLALSCVTSWLAYQNLQRESPVEQQDEAVDHAFPGTALPGAPKWWVKGANLHAYNEKQ